MAIHMILMSAAGSSSAPTTGTYWINVLGSSGFQYATDIVADDINGRIYILYNGTPGTGSTYYFNMAQYALNGALNWQKYMSGTGNFDSTTSLAITPAGVVWGAGGMAALGNQGYTQRISSSGSVVSRLNVGNTTGTQSSYTRGMSIDSTGATRYSMQSTVLQGCYTIAQTTANAISWQRVLTGGYQTLGTGGTAVDASNNVYVAGTTQATSTFSSRVILVAKYNSTGTIQWQRTLTQASVGSDSAELRSIRVDSSANCYVVGSYANYIFLAKFNTSGTLQWQRRINIPGVAAAGIDVDSFDQIFISGYVGTTGFYAIYNSSGTLFAQRTITNFALSGIYSGRNSLDLYLSGTTTAYGTNDAALMKVPADATLTGTYGPFVYAASSYTESAGTGTAATSTLTASNGTLASAVPSYTVLNGSNTNTFTLIQA